MSNADLLTEDALELIAGADTSAFAIDLRDRIIYWNAGAEKILGWSSEEALGKFCFDILAGRDPFGNLYCMKDCAALQTAREGRASDPFFMEVNQKKGGNRRVLVRVVPLPAAGASCSALMHFLDRGDGAEVDRLIRSLKAAARQPLAERRPDPPISVSPLTAREREIVNLLSNGYAALNIAAKLNLSHATVRNHIQNILRKLEVHSQVEAISVAFRRGWI